MLQTERGAGWGVREGIRDLRFKRRKGEEERLAGNEKKPNQLFGNATFSKVDFPLVKMEK